METPQYNLAGIIDLGSGKIKAGLSTEEDPSLIFPSLIGHPKFNKILPINSQEEIVGPDSELRGLYTLDRPIKNGKIQNRADAKMIFNKIYNDLNICSNREIPIFIAEPPFTCKKQKKMLAELLFENFDAPSVFFGTQGVLSLYAFGKTEGIVLESGKGITQIVPITNGYKLDYAVQKINFGGEDVDQYLKLLLKKNGIYLYSSSEDCILEEMKEKVCQLKDKAFDRNQRINLNDVDSHKTEDFEYKLPDGEIISIGSERFIAPEVLFNPSIAGMEFPGLHEFLDSAIKKMDLDLRKNFYGNIVLSGGNSMLNGFSERLANEMEPLVAEKTKLTILAAEVDRSCLVWKGASSIINVDSFANLWIGKKDYEEHGDRIFLMKTF